MLQNSQTSCSTVHCPSQALTISSSNAQKSSLNNGERFSLNRPGLFLLSARVCLKPGRLWLENCLYHGTDCRNSLPWDWVYNLSLSFSVSQSPHLWWCFILLYSDSMKIEWVNSCKTCNGVWYIVSVQEIYVFALINRLPVATLQFWLVVVRIRKMEICKTGNRKRENDC